MLDHYTTGPHVSYLISIPILPLFVKGMNGFVIYGKNGVKTGEKERKS